MGFAKNLERERILLSCWKQGLSNRETALKTGIPEGTVNRYFARFNKNPEKYKRELPTEVEKFLGYEPNKIMSDLLKIPRIEEVANRHERLMDEERYLDAKTALEAEIQYDLFRSKMGELSDVALLRSNPKKYELAIPQIVRRALATVKRDGYVPEGHLENLEVLVASSGLVDGLKAKLLAEIKNMRNSIVSKREGEVKERHDKIFPPVKKVKYFEIPPEREPLPGFKRRSSG